VSGEELRRMIALTYVWSSSSTKRENMKVVALPLVAFTIIFAMGCSTTGHFRVPDDTVLYVHERPVEVESNGTVTTPPFFWTAAAGIRYRVEKNGVIVKEGKLRSRFRPVSIFWPPYALIYWPIGFRDDVMYDLVSDTQKELVTAPPSGGVSDSRPEKNK
jgi:hypothetical protein